MVPAVICIQTDQEDESGLEIEELDREGLEREGLKGISYVLAKLRNI